jgi:hypothetical protein
VVHEGAVGAGVIIGSGASPFLGESKEQTVETVNFTAVSSSSTPKATVDIFDGMEFTSSGASLSPEDVMLLWEVACKVSSSGATLSAEGMKRVYPLSHFRVVVIAITY